MKIAFTAKPAAKLDALVVGVFKERTLTTSAAAVDRQTKGALGRAMSAGRFTGAKSQFLDVVAPVGAGAQRVVLAGLGKRGALDELGVQDVGGALVAHLNRVGAKQATVVVDGWGGRGKFTAAAQAANLAYGARLRGYRFDKYRTKEKDKDKPTLGALTAVVRQARAAQAAFARLDR
ncbi:MAG: M17 family peptidase N-terminal domain-containing protein, partial [Alphaproteobacteria bacterium]